MAREKKLSFGVINITMQPHSPQLYIDLFRMAYSAIKPINVWGDQYAILSGLMSLEKSKDTLKGITGDIFRFTHIDKDGNWFNTETSNFAEPEDLGSLNIPANLKPNSSRFSYIFYPKEHLFFYESYYDTKTFNPASAVNFLTKLFNQEKIIENFGKIEVTHVPEINKLAEALKLPVKEKIELHIKRPNADDHAQTERRVMKRMNDMNVEELNQTYKALPGKSIEMDKDLDAMAHVAAKNGHITLKGKDNTSKPVIFSTKSHPYVYTEYYDPDSQAVFDIFETISKSIKQEISNWFKK